MTLDPEPGSWKVWLLAIRPRTLPAAVAPVMVGTALAAKDGVSDPLPAVAALAGSLLIQIVANLANDYLDYVKGVDIPQRIGPRRVAQSGLIALPRLRSGIACTFALATLIGAYLTYVGGWPILVIGFASLLSALAYTGGPFPIGYHGLGDLFVFLFFGLAAVCGTYYVQALSCTSMVLLAAIPVGLLTVAILVVNNLRDIKTDRETGKRTLAVIIGARATRLEFLLLLTVAYSVPVLFWLLGWSTFWIFLPWLSLPYAMRLAHTVLGTARGPTLNWTLAGTANLDLVFSILFAVGILL